MKLTPGSYGKAAHAICRHFRGAVALQGNLWKRKGWKEMDKMRSKLEDLKELRDLVRV